jgi:hypothetical protein
MIELSELSCLTSYQYAVWCSPHGVLKMVLLS